MQNDSAIPGAGAVRRRVGDFRGGNAGETNCHADCRFTKMKREGRNLNETETVCRDEERKGEGTGGGGGLRGETVVNLINPAERTPR